MKMSAVAKEFLEDFISLIFPKVCVHCDTPLVMQEDHICTACRLSLPKTDFHLQPDNTQMQKFAFEPGVKQVATYLHFHKGGIAQSVIHELKYKNNPAIGELIGIWYGADLQRVNWPLDLIIPVPLHPSKFQRRGYNQSEHFAMGLAQSLKVPLRPELVKRIRRTTSQTRKSKVARWENMDSVYEIVGPEAINDKNILLVDDVLTTGATIGELATLLMTSGARGIYVVTMAAGK